MKRLRRRLALLCGGATAAILAVLSLVLLSAAERRLRSHVDAAFLGNIATLSYRLQDEHSVSWDWLSQMETDQRLLVSIYDNGAPLRFPGVWQTRTPRKRLLQVLERQAPPGSVTPAGNRYAYRLFRLKGDEGEPYLAAAVAVPADRGGERTMYLVKDLADVDFGGMRLFFLAVSAASALALAGFSWWFSGRVLRPVEAGMRRQTEFVAAASHELRSPLGVMRANAAAVREQAPPQAGAYAAAIEEECSRLGRLVEDLLTLAAADAGRLTLRLGPVEPLELLERVAGRYAPLAQERGVALGLRTPPGGLPLLEGDEERLIQLLEILLDNALRYVPPRTGRIELSAGRRGRQVWLRVADNGPGLPPGERQTVLRRFYRSDAARASQGEKTHYGLGLSIAADIAKLHGAQLELSDTPGGGLTVEYRQNRCFL